MYFINSWHIARGVVGAKLTRLFYPVATAVPAHVYNIHILVSILCLLVIAITKQVSVGLTMVENSAGLVD